MDCPRCGHVLPESPPPYCPQCGAPTAGGEATGLGAPGPGEGRVDAPVVTFTPPPPEPPPIGGPPRDGPPWERRSSFFDLGAWGSTIAGVLFDAPATFRRMRREGGVLGPLLFYWPLALVFTWIGIAWSVGQQRLMSGMPGGDANPFAGLGIDPARLVGVQLILAPVFSVLIWFIWSGIAHLFLMMVGGARQSFETTMRVMAYAMGATSVFQIIPICGGLIGFLWALVVEIIGIAEAHETSTGRAAAAVLLPIVLCCLCLVIGLFVAVAMGISLLDAFKT